MIGGFVQDEELESPIPSQLDSVIPTLTNLANKRVVGQRGAYDYLYMSRATTLCYAYSKKFTMQRYKLFF